MAGWKKILTDTVSNGEWSGTDLAVVNGGTGASSAGSARTNLGITYANIGTVDISSNTNLAAGTNISLSGDTLNVDDAFLKNDASDTTTGTITAAGLGLSANGSLGSPVIFRSSDTNTGLCFLGTDSLGLVAGASAGTKLQITGVNDASKIVTGTQDVDAGLFLDFAYDDSQGDWKFYLGDWDGETNETFLMVDDVENEIVLTCGGVYTTAGTFHIDSSANAVVSIDRGATSRFGCTNYKTAGSTIWSTGLTDSDNAGLDGSEYYIGPSQGGASPDFLLATNGDLTLTGIVSTVGRVQITGNGTPTVTGGGLELGYTSNTGKILALDRNGTVYKALELNGASHSFKISGTEKFSIDSSGNAAFVGTVSGVTNMATITSDIDSSPTIYVDNDAPSGGSTGDVWLEY